MIIPISIVFFIRFRKQKKDLIKYGICISIFILILFSMEYLRNDITEQNVFVSHISAGPAYYQASIEEKSSTLADFIYLGIIDLIRYVGWSQIPYFIIFTPIGIMFIFKSLDYKKILIILSIVLMLIPAFYAYSRGFPEIKYLYVLYPIFCVLACFTFKIFFEKFHRKNLICCIIIGGIILSSVIFVDWKSQDNEHHREAFRSRLFWLLNARPAGIIPLHVERVWRQSRPVSVATAECSANSEQNLPSRSQSIVQSRRGSDVAFRRYHRQWIFCPTIRLPCLPSTQRPAAQPLEAATSSAFSKSCPADQQEPKGLFPGYPVAAIDHCFQVGLRLGGPQHPEASRRTA